MCRRFVCWMTFIADASREEPPMCIYIYIYMQYLMGELMPKNHTFSIVSRRWYAYFYVHIFKCKYVCHIDHIVQYQNQWEFGYWATPSSPSYHIFFLNIFWNGRIWHTIDRSMREDEYHMGNAHSVVMHRRLTIFF